MSIRTVEQLYDFLSDELAWRKKELAELRWLIQSTKIPTNKQDVLIRSGISMLYAHWEGFVKKAASAYLEFVAMQRLPYTELSANFVATAMKVKLDKARNSNKASIFVEVAQFFLTGLSSKSSISTSVNTKSNLSFDVFREITIMLGIDFSLYLMKQKVIDERLLKARNNIAHGHYLTVDQKSYMDLHAQVIELINLFRNQIDNAAYTSVYRRS
jgi:hypothetical protein